jgi:hypothetical protein
MENDKRALATAKDQKQIGCFFAVISTLAILLGLYLVFDNFRESGLAGFLCIGFGLAFAGFSVLLNGLNQVLRLLGTQKDDR